MSIDSVRPAVPIRRMSIQVSVEDGSALWAVASATLGQRYGLALDEIVETIGDVSQPDIDACLAAILDPSSLTGCVVGAFEIETATLGRAALPTAPFALHRAPAEPRLWRRARETDQPGRTSLGC